MAFAPGDVVILKSGGQQLTVVAVEGDSVECIWLADDGTLHRETIPDLALVAVEYDEEGQEHDEGDEDAA